MLESSVFLVSLLYVAAQDRSLLTFKSSLVNALLYRHWGLLFVQL